MLRQSLIFLTAFLSLGACGGGGLFASRNVPPLEQYSAEQIFRLGEFELAEENPDDAAQYFGEVERLYPYSEWAKRALIMQAFSFHRDRDYENARAAAQRKMVKTNTIIETP